MVIGSLRQSNLTTMHIAFKLSLWTIPLVVKELFWHEIIT